MSLSQEAAADATTGYARDTVLTASQRNGSNFGCNRVINVILIFLFIAAIVLQVTCIASMWHKHEEIKHEWDCTDEKCSPLFIKFEDETHGEFGDNIYCYAVVYGSGASALCSLAMVILLPIRIVKYKR